MRDLANSPGEFSPNGDGEVRCYVCEELGSFILGSPKPGRDEILEIECTHYAEPLYIHRRCLEGRYWREIDMLYLRRTGQMLFEIAGRVVH